QPELPALALGLATERGIELTVPARQQRHLAGLLRRGPEAARLRAGDPNLAALVARLEPRLERGPVRPCDRFDRRQGDPPRTVDDRLADLGGDQPLLLERGVGGHAEQ